MSTTTLKLHKTDSELIEKVGHHVHLSEGNDWYFMPFWFKKMGEGLYAEHRFEDLPEDLKTYLTHNKTQL